MFKRGGIYAVNLPHGDRHEPEVCPCLVVSNNISNEYSPVVTIIPLSFTHLEKIYDFETFLPAAGSGLEKDAKISSHILITIDKATVVGERLGFINKSLMCQVNKALCLQLGIEEPPGHLKG
ncbi:type II toxin-antitoxin system PemK/MazF family toxin [Geobacter grbiciae]|uniref:type II toxin-antitoxin system PemK/MazF family toxin n=1 Tax=Geobacter grbiciae TaxID=155042 RepID=UPI001C0235AC|nr:type II toxin-antitoxin system PemK/MazF family toxin [Geobacter grbiciae]MBT1075684.1 type II toxin-antitoxin system PemK/MazF family toxin [Geobacter grbiciae]